MTPQRVVDVLALILGLVIWSYAGWDGALWDPRWQLFLHIAAVAAVGGMVMFMVAGGMVPRTRIDLPLIGLLLAFAIACLSAWNAGLSARALGAIVATAAMLPVALIAIRHRPGWTAAIVVVPIIALAGESLWILASHRIDWILAGGPGLPPVRLGREGTIFGSVAVAPFVILASLPVALLVPHRALRRTLAIALTCLGIPLALISGSRSAWLAIGVAVAILAVPAFIRAVRSSGFRRRWTPGASGLLALGLLLSSAALLFVAPRLTDVGSVVYRSFLWRDTLAAASGDPLFGIGPGSMAWARQAAAPALSFPVRQPHSHDVFLGIYGDAGVIGVAAALVVCITFVAIAGPWRTRSLPGRAAFAVLGGFAVGLLFEDLTFLPNFNLLVVLLAAIALADAGAVTWERLSLKLPVVAATSVAALALVAVMTVGDVAAIAYRLGTDAAGSERWPDAVAWLERSIWLDPWNPTGPKALTVAADRDGRSTIARRAAARAVQLNAGDGQSWLNLAVLCREENDASCALRASTESVATAAAQGRELANAALVFEWLGESARADRAYRLSLLTNYWTALALPWPRPVPVGDGITSELGAPTAELNLLIARRVDGVPIAPESYDIPVVRALAAAMVGDRAGAESAMAEAIETAAGSATTWEFAALLARHYGEDDAYARRLAGITRGAELLGEGITRPALLIFDIATFRAYPGNGLVSGAEPLLPDTPWPWVLEPLLQPAG